MKSTWDKEETKSLTLGSNDDPNANAKENAKSKMNYIFWQNSQLSRSVRYANGSKYVLRLNMQWQHLIPNGNTKN